MKKINLIGLISECALAVCALVCLIIAAVAGETALIVASAIVMLVSLYIAGGFLADHLVPEFNYFGWVVWFWNVFCKKWVWQNFCVNLVYKKFDKWKGWLYLSPALVLLAVFTFWPIVSTVRIAFLKDYDIFILQGNPGHVFELGLDNFKYVLGYQGFRTCLLNTLFLCVITVPVSTFLALLIAVCLNSIKFLNRFLQTIYFLPYVTNSIAIGLVFATMFSIVGIDKMGANASIGIVNTVIEFFGGTRIDWMGDDPGLWMENMLVIIIYIVWNALPFKILILLGGLQSVNKQYYDAAKIDSTPKWRVFTRITVPLLSPMITYVVITGFIGGFKEYSSIVGLFGNAAGKLPDRLNTMVGYIYQAIDANQGLASAASLILFAIIFVVTMINLHVSKKNTHY